MPHPVRPNRELTGKVTMAAVVAAIACCALPLLITAGVITSAGVALRNLAVVGVGIALAAWLVLQAVRRTRQRADSGTVAPPSHHSAHDEQRARHVP